MNSSSSFKKALWYPTVGLVLALCTPEQMVSESELLKLFVSNAGEWIPAIRNLSVVSSFPMITGLYLSVMWALLPFTVMWWIRILFQTRKKPLTFPSFRYLLPILALIPFVLVLVMSVIYWFPYYPDERQISLHAGRSGVFLMTIMNFRLGLGVCLGAFFYTFAFFLMAWLIFLWLGLVKFFQIFKASF